MIAVIDCRMPKKAVDRLLALGFSVIPLPPFSSLAEPVASHPDMLLFPFEDRLFVYRAYYEQAKSVIDQILNESGKSLCMIDISVTSEYPNDIALNLFTINKYLFGKADRIPSEIAKTANETGYCTIHTRQGYAKCSTVVLGNCGIISADPSILKAAAENGIDTLSISSGNVLLPGYDHGFLGGASGVSESTVFFCGEITTHPDHHRIRAFCQERGFSVISLSDEPLLDVGTIFFL